MNLTNQPQPKHKTTRRGRVGITLIELLVVVLILGILSTIATNVYVGQTVRAKIASDRVTIREIAVAINRYEIDTGQLPPSGSANVSGSGGTITISNISSQGNGLLFLALQRSLSGNVFAPLSRTWQGPYLEFNVKMLFQSSIPGQTQMLSAFDIPFQYVRSSDYATLPFAGTQLFSGSRPAGSSPDLLENNPFFATETFYNPTTFQIYSFGPDNVTPAPPFAGTDINDITNFGG